MHHDSITTINQQFDISDLDFCREQGPEKQFVRMNYFTNTPQDQDPCSRSNRDYNGYVLHTVPTDNKIPNSPTGKFSIRNINGFSMGMFESDSSFLKLSHVFTAINSEPFLLGINEPIHDEDFDESPATNRSLHRLVTNSDSIYNGQSSPQPLHHEQPVVDYTHKKLRQRRASNRFSPKNTCSWVCTNMDTKMLTFVVDVEIMTNRELLETQVKSHPITKSTVNRKRGNLFSIH